MTKELPVPDTWQHLKPQTIDVLRERHFHDPKKDPYGALAPPIQGITGEIYTSIAYVFENAEQARATFAGEPGARDYFYSRVGKGQPPVEALRRCLVDLELGKRFPEKEKENYDAVLTPSGMSSIFLLMLQYADNFREVIASSKCYGGTYHLLFNRLKRLGITTHKIVHPLDLNEWRRAALDHPNATMLFAEDDANPKPIKLNNVALADIAHEHSMLYVCDRTIGTPILENPLATGTDIIVHSLSKEYGGESGALGGAIIARNELIEPFNHKDDGWMPPTGLVMDARVADYFLSGARTLEKRINQKQKTVKKIAKFLRKHPRVKEVFGPGGNVLAFEIRGTAEGAARVVEALRLILFAPHLGDLQTLAIPPYSTTHSPMPEEDRLKHDITPTLIRLSIGLEDPDDIIDDLKQALEK